MDGGQPSHDEKHYYEGITRSKEHDKFIYYYVSTGEEVNKKDLERIHKLRIPPAWTDVWVSRDANASIQVIGKDSRGRKQYRYHQVHIEKADKEKFIRLYEFIKVMPKLDRIMESHQKLGVYDRDRVISLMLQIVKEHYLRVGKEVYARENKSYGISSLRKNHVTLHPTEVVLRFKGKSNQRLHYTIKKQEFVNGIKMLMKLEGDRLFQYIMVDDMGREKIYSITDRDLNKYIQTYIGNEFTIKDFRTFAANETFLKAILNETKKRKPKSRQSIKKNLINAFKNTARHLKHTKAVSKKSYVMNFILEFYQNSPEFFINNINSDPTTLLLDILKMYKKNVLD